MKRFDFIDFMLRVNTDDQKSVKQGGKIKKLNLEFTDVEVLR
jgi:hypothetical protein